MPVIEKEIEMTTIEKREELKDFELIDAYKKGDKVSLDILLNRYKNYIFNLSYRFMHNYEDAMDLTQEVLIRVYRAIDKYEERNYFKGWLYRIVNNAAINTYAKSYRKESPYLEKLDLINDARYNTEENYERIYLQEKINKASMALKGKQKDVFILRYYENYSYKEIAKILDISSDSAKSNYFYSLKKMKEILDKENVVL